LNGVTSGRENFVLQVLELEGLGQTKVDEGVEPSFLVKPFEIHIEKITVPRGVHLYLSGEKMEP